ncbi:hypothetical protein HD806DRAFT_381044 [Xylariaceae sp. AK1471]|nr:hypothetical protein HD806DRAFT_381044 [Xylariaceae sp. AK1471]
MSPPKNGDIRGFFRSVGPSSSQTQMHPASSPPGSLPDLPSSPRTPTRSTPRVFNRTDEIKGSDDSDDDSDDSLGSITGALGYRSSPAAHQRGANVLSTPQAKRIASGVHRSPLTLQPKKHKFDLKALIKHSREIAQTEESIKQADALIALEDKNNEKSDDSDTENDPRLKAAARQQLFIGRDNDEDGKGDKLRRAMKRSDGDEASSRKHCYFFNQEGPLYKPGANAFPRKKAVGRWKCLAQADTRRQTFMMGLPYAFVGQGETLPDELFQWILDEVCTEQNADLRRHYVNLIELCEDNTQRVVNDMRLYALLERIGGPRYAREHSKFKSTTEMRNEYLERNWSPLVTFLQLLDRIAPNLQTSSAISALQLLLRMSLDPVVATVVREHHMRAMTTLVSRLAKSTSQWDTACEAICSYIYENVDDLELKVTSLLSIPSSSSHLVDLRRRIAAESLFSEAGLGSKPIDPCLSLERISNRLDEDDIKSTHKPGFDYEHLRALLTLLDIVIDRADFMRPSILSTPGKINESSKNSRNKNAEEIAAVQNTKSSGNVSNPDADTKAEAEQKFDSEIDVLSSRIKALNDKIRDKDTTKNVKLSLLGLEKRLKYAVRTRPPPKKEIFASDGTTLGARAPAVNVPKQREFMRQWALKKKAEKENKQEGEGRLENAEFADGGRERASKSLQVAVG